MVKCDALGINSRRFSSLGAFSESASEHCTSESASSRMRSGKLDVDTVMRRSLDVEPERIVHHADRFESTCSGSRAARPSP